MDYEKYYDRRGDGSYVIHFPNNKGLTMKEVNTIFSSFGKVLSADDRGQPNGLCFVKLETAEDAKQCIEAFKNHKFIKILPHITKKFVNVKRKSYNENKKAFKQNFTVNNSDNNIKNNNINSNDLYVKKIQEKCNQSDSNISESISMKDNFNDDIKIEENKKSTSISSLRHLLKLKNLRKAASSTSISSEATNENLNRLEEIPFNETEIPSLISIDKKYKSHNIKVPSSSTKVIPTQEVIVANIHPNISIHYILHLFEKYNPISVSLMMTTPNTRILYCHVYFKTYEEAYSTMKEFDKYSLHGKYLIVLTSEKLIEEAL